MRCMPILGLALTTCRLGGGPTTSKANEENDAYERPKGLEWLVGEWTSTMNYEDKVVTFSITNQWLYSKNFLRSK